MFVLIHSPLVGPMTWQPAQDLLRARNLPVVAPSLVGGIDDGPPYYPKLAARVATVVRAALPKGPVVLVAHSGAGAMVPSVAAACGGAVEAAVFVDAILPHPGRSWFDTAPPSMSGQLRTLASGGRLPPWHQWFPAGMLDALLPDPDLRARFVAEIPTMPVAFFDEPAPLIPHQAYRCGYLQLSSAYQGMADEAERRGWSTVRRSVDHLGILTQPKLVVDCLESLAASLGVAES